MNSAPFSEQGKDSQTGKLLEITSIRLEAANATIELLKERIREKDATIAALEDGRAARMEQIAELKTANKDRSTVNTGDARMLDQANVIIAKQDAEIAKLRNPGFFASLFDTRTAYGLIGGYGACKLTSGNETRILQAVNPFANSGIQMFQTSADQKAREALRHVVQKTGKSL